MKYWYPGKLISTCKTVSTSEGIQIKIPGGTDCYYCINNMTFLIHVYYCLDVLLLFLIIYPLSCYMYALLLYLFHAIPSEVAYYSCTCILCIAYILFCIVYLLTMHNTVGWLYCICHLHVHFYHVTTSMFLSITSPLGNSTYYINWIRL